MKTETRGEFAAEMLDGYFEGEMSASETLMFEAELAGSVTARRLFEEERRLRAAFVGPTSELQSFDLADRVCRSINEARVPRLWQPPTSVRYRGAALAVVAAFGLILGLSALKLRSEDSTSAVVRSESFDHSSERTVREDQEFRPKGGPLPPAVRGKWAGINVYRIGVNGSKPEPLGESMSSNDALLFSYSNLGPKPFEYVMVFAVDANGDVFWFFPAYEREGSNPVSVPLRKGVHAVEFDESVRYQLAPGPLEIRALFTAGPLRVLEVESWLAHHPLAGAALPWSDASEQAIRTLVTVAAGPLSPSGTN